MEYIPQLIFGELLEQEFCSASLDSVAVCWKPLKRAFNQWATLQLNCRIWPSAIRQISVKTLDRPKSEHSAAWLSFVSVWWKLLRRAFDRGVLFVSACWLSTDNGHRNCLTPPHCAHVFFRRKLLRPRVHYQKRVLNTDFSGKNIFSLRVQCQKSHVHVFSPCWT